MHPLRFGPRMALGADVQQVRRHVDRRIPRTAHAAWSPVMDLLSFRDPADFTHAASPIDHLLGLPLTWTCLPHSPSSAANSRPCTTRTRDAPGAHPASTHSPAPSPSTARTAQSVVAASHARTCPARSRCCTTLRAALPATTDHAPRLPRCACTSTPHTSRTRRRTRVQDRSRELPRPTGLEHSSCGSHHRRRPHPHLKTRTTHPRPMRPPRQAEHTHPPGPLVAG